MFTLLYFLQWRPISSSISLDHYILSLHDMNTDKEHEFLPFLAFSITYVINIFHQSKIWNLLSWQTVFSTCCDETSRTTVICKSFFLHVMLQAKTTPATFDTGYPGVDPGYPDTGYPYGRHFWLPWHWPPDTGYPTLATPYLLPLEHGTYRILP
jgi:hypothetical protein